MLDNLGLVLSGGGGKGAYEIGVWKALHEQGIDQKIKAVSGASIGALNAALFLQGDLEKAERTWLSITPEKILSIRADRIVKWLIAAGFGSLDNPATLSLAYRIASHGVFSRQGLLEIVHNEVDLSRIKHSPIPAFAACYNFKEDKVEYFCLNDSEEERIISILLASSAIPGVFGQVEIDGISYVDGGLKDNSPVKPLYEMGLNTILLVSLSRSSIMDYRNYPGVRILPIVPRPDLGGFFSGTMDFTREGAERRMRQGYEDACYILSHLEGIINNEAEYQSLWEEIARGEEKYQETLNRQIEVEHRHQEILQAVQDFNQLIINDQFIDEFEFTPWPARDPLAESNLALLNQIERSNILSQVNYFIEKNQDIGYAVQDAAFEAIAYLAPVEGRSLHLQEQSFLARIWGDISGNNQQIIASNEKDLAMAQYAAMTLIQRINEKGFLTLEFSAALNNKTNLLFAEIARTNENINQQYLDIYRSLGLLFVKFRREIMSDRDAIDKLEERLNILEWRTNIKVHSFNGIEYRYLTPVSCLLCVINDFYQITKGNWNIKELLSLRSALIDLELADTTTTLEDFINELDKNPLLKRRYVEGLYHTFQLRYPPLLSLIRDSGTVPAEEIKTEVEKRLNYNLEVEIPVYTLALELMYELQRTGYKVVDKRELAGLKKDMMQQLDSIRNIADKYNTAQSFLQDINTLEEEILQFKIAVPLMGDFSSGKSTLLNAFLGSQFLPTDLGPETSIATELHAAVDNQEKLVLYYLNGDSREYTAGEYKQVISNVDQILYAELHLVNDSLMEYPDIILVDMPGLDSNLGNHNKAILNYIHQGVSFIVCASAEYGLTNSLLEFFRNESIYQCDINLLITQKDLKDESEIPGILELNRDTVISLTGQNIFAGTVSAVNQDLDDFYQCLEHIEACKESLLQVHFGGAISELANRLTVHLQLIQNRDNLSALELEQKKKEIEKGMTELKRVLEEEVERIFSKCRNQLPEQVASDIRSVLEQNRNQLKASAQGDLQARIQGLVTNTLRQSLTDRSRPVFNESLKRLSTYVSEHIYNVIEPGTATYSTGVEPALISGGNKEDLLPTLATGLGGFYLGGPLLGTLLVMVGGIVGWITKQVMEEKINQAINDMINRVSSDVKGEAAHCLEEMAQRFTGALREKVTQVIQEMNHSISLLEEQIQKNENEINAFRNDIAADLLAIEGIIGFKSLDGDTNPILP